MTDEFEVFKGKKYMGDVTIAVSHLLRKLGDTKSLENYTKSLNVMMSKLGDSLKDVQPDAVDPTSDVSGGANVCGGDPLVVLVCGGGPTSGVSGGANV